MKTSNIANNNCRQQQLFTKIAQVLFSHLRKLVHASVVAYVDESYLEGDTYQTCLQNVLDTISIFRRVKISDKSKKKQFQSKHKR